MEGMRPVMDDNFRSRCFQPDMDSARLEHFMYATTACCSAYTFGHIGNLSWSMFYNTSVDPSTSARLWEDADGSLLGLSWFDGGEFVMHVEPALRGSGVLESRMIAWAEKQKDRSNPQGVSKLVVSADDGDSAYITLLEQHGFVRQGGEYVVLERTLGDPISEVALPEGATVRHVVHRDEYAERVDAHRDAFEPSRFTLEAYQNVRMAPGYDPELDLVAVLPDGTFASYCICWWDAVNKRGLFEPVGTRKAWQRQGFGRAVLLEGLQRLRARGALMAEVATAAGNTEAVRLYESVGMRIVRQGASYVK